MSRKYTEHNISEAGLKRLAQLASPSREHHHGTAMYALSARGLVTAYGDKPWPDCCQITATGWQALTDARAEGW